jgi:hypothetical protein
MFLTEVVEKNETDVSCSVHFSASAAVFEIIKQTQCCVNIPDTRVQQLDRSE